VDDRVVIEGVRSVPSACPSKARYTCDRSQNECRKNYSSSSETSENQRVASTRVSLSLKGDSYKLMSNAWTQMYCWSRSKVFKWPEQSDLLLLHSTSEISQVPEQRFLRPKLHSRVHNIQPLITSLSQMNPLNIPKPWCSEIHFKINPLPSDLFPSPSPTDIPYAFSAIPCVLQV
jgi:hypothetical protein